MITPTTKFVEKPNGSITMPFYLAMKEITNGHSVKRISWSGNDYCLLKDGWLTIFTKGDFHIWQVNDGDIEGEDWVTIREEN